MKTTKQQLKRIIKEELKRVLKESSQKPQEQPLNTIKTPWGSTFHFAYLNDKFGPHPLSKETSGFENSHDQTAWYFIISKDGRSKEEIKTGESTVSDAETVAEALASALMHYDPPVVQGDFGWKNLSTELESDEDSFEAITDDIKIFLENDSKFMDDLEEAVNQQY